MSSKAGTRMDMCACGNEKQARSRRCKGCAIAIRRGDPTSSSTVAADRERTRVATELTSLRRRYDEALRTIERQERDLSASNILRGSAAPFVIKPRLASGTAEGTVVAVASDWHIEEIVGPEVGTLNRYNLDIARARAIQFFQATLRLTTLLQQDIRIDTLVLALLGDFITNELHGADSAEKNELAPTAALVEVQNLLISGIQFLLNESKLTLVVPCHSGNHARTTLKTRFGAENGHSLEYLMYSHLAAYFRHEPRVTFIIPEGYHSYVKVYDQVIRFHHGHTIRYAGGVGGIFIPTHKAIAAWNQAIPANLDVFGHFHRLVDGGSFICNGSMIGMNAYALSIKAPFEPPKQTLFLIDKQRGRTCTWPILFSDPAATRKKAA